MTVSDRNIFSSVSRTKVASALVVIAFSLIGLRLWYLQVVRGDFFREQSESNRFKQVYIPPTRGDIMDRHGRILVSNRPAFNIELVREECPDIKATVKKLAALIGEDEQSLLQRAALPATKRRAFEPRILLADVDRDLVARVASHKHLLPGIVIAVASARVYQEGEFAAHLLGYIREISQQQLDSGQYPGYLSGDLVGHSGVEKLQEYLLFGKRGVQQVIVNAVGVRMGELYNESDVPGHSLMLTIDHATQFAADQALRGKSGTVVALDPRSGEILALASHPGFDPNIFSKTLEPQQWQQLTQGVEKPLSNRAISGEYPPGSVFKIFMAVAALAEGIINPQSEFKCAGYYRVGNSRRFQCNKREGHGTLDLAQALKLSCNVYFYNLGQQLGIDRIHEYAARFGFGSKVELGLPGERVGLVPSTAWKRKAFKNPSDQRWYPGETPSVAIGQGALVVTPLQVARATAALVNGGVLYKPSIVKRIAARSGSSFDDHFSPEVQGYLEIDQSVLEQVQEGLALVVNEERGTAYNRGRLAEDLGVKMAGKTGTAQTRSLANSSINTDLGWFAGYAPLKNPEIVIVAMIEGEGGGGLAAAPVVKAVAEAYFKSMRFKDEDTSHFADNKTKMNIQAEAG